MQETVLFDEIRNVLASQVQCVLATLDDEQPYLHLMAYGFNECLNEVYLASYADTRKVRNMLAQANVSLLWDNRTGNSQDHLGGLALNAAGKARQLDDDASKAKQLLLDRNPTLDKLLSSDQSAIFAVDVAGYVFVKGYTDVQEYIPA